MARRKLRPRHSSETHIGTMLRAAIFLSLAAAVICTPAIGIQPRIAGGEKADSITSQVSIQHKGTHVCGGELLNEFHVLTAASCIVPLSNSKTDITIKGGSIDLKGNNVQERKVQTIYVHPQFGSGSINKISLENSENVLFPINNLAIIRVGEKFTISETLTYHSLNETKPAPGEVCAVSGWGKTSNDPNPPTSVQLNTFRKVMVFDLTRCLGFANLEAGSSNVTINDVCFDTVNNAKLFCEGDQGSGMICGKSRLSGIVSWQTDCDNRGTFVTPVDTKWITEQMKKSDEEHKPTTTPLPSTPGKPGASTTRGSGGSTTTQTPVTKGASAASISAILLLGALFVNQLF